ncbi:unnamed protein product [Closterium sp. NIES-53]
MYLMTCTRPDLAYSLSILARYVAPGRHRPEHMAAAKRVLCYLCSTSGMGLVLGGRRPVVLTGHADASWADDQATQRSSQGYTFSLGSGSVSWRSTRSSFVLSSSCEAEIYAGAMAAQELRWLTYLLTDLGEQPRSPPVLYVDNKAMLALCREHRLEHRTKHIALRYFLARELQQRGQLRLAYVASEANTADIFTKALAPGDHQRFCTLLGARTRGTRAARASGIGGAGAGDPRAGGAGAGGARAGGTGAEDPGAGGAGAGGARAGGTGARSTRAGGPGARDTRAGGAGSGVAAAGGTGAGGTVQLRPFFVPPPLLSLPPPGSVLFQRREPASRPGRRVPCPRPPPVHSTHIMALRPSSVPLRVPLLSPPASSLADGPDPEYDLARAASPTLTRLLASVVTDPSFESNATSALVAELVDFAVACRLDYAASLVAKYVSDCPTSVGGECALDTDVLEDRQEDFECLAAVVLQRFGFRHSSPQSTPPPTCHLLSAPPSDESVEPSGPYPKLVGCLMYLMTCTRPNLAYPLSIRACYVAPRRHRPEDWEVAKRVLRYLCNTSGMGIVLGGRGPVVLTGHADASWVDDLATQRSGHGCTGVTLAHLRTDLEEPPRSPLVLYVDNKAMIALCQERRLEHKTKHIALRYFLARELQQRGQLRLAYVATQANTVDIFTKALQPCDHQRFCTVLGLVPVLSHLLTV